MPHIAPSNLYCVPYTIGAKKLLHKVKHMYVGSLYSGSLIKVCIFRMSCSRPLYLLWVCATPIQQFCISGLAVPKHRAFWSQLRPMEQSCLSSVNYVNIRGELSGLVALSLECSLLPNSDMDMCTVADIVCRIGSGLYSCSVIASAKDKNLQEASGSDWPFFFEIP